MDSVPLAARAAVVVSLVSQLACAGVSLPQPGLPAADVVAGFDTRDYPGDEAMAAWLASSPYRWVGYYLGAPCYTGTSWQGRRAALHTAGWGTAAIFVGEQDWSAMQLTAGDSTVAEEGARCTTRNLTVEQGRLDAQSADSAMAAEGFAPGTPVFLDVERMEQVSSAMEAYVRAWFDAMLALGRYRPALYAHERNVTTLYETGRAAFAAAGRSDTPILWVARAGDFDVTRRPSDSGILTASIWQGVFDDRQTWGGVTLVVDGNVASPAIPGILPSRSR